MKIHQAVTEVVYTMTWACISRLSKNSSKNLNLNFTLMYTPIQLEAIKLFGRKDLTEGCVSIEKDWTLWKCDVREEWRTINLPEWQRNVTSSEIEWEILWHIPHLEDLFRVAFDRGIYISISPEITRVYKEFWWEPIEIVLVPQTPLLDQPSLPEIISLFK